MSISAHWEQPPWRPSVTPDSDYLRRLQLVEPTTDPALDRLARMACVLLEAPVSMVSIIDARRARQFFKSMFSSDPAIRAGFPERRETPLTHALCRFVAESNETLSINDAALDARFRAHPAHAQLGVRAYLGSPIHLPDGRAIGAICVLDHHPRDWDAKGIERLQELAGCVDDAIRLAAALDETAIERNAAARARAARDLFFTGMNHEVLTSLNGVLGFSDLLEEVVAEEETREIARAISRCTVQLRNLLWPVLRVTDCLDSGPPTDGGKSFREILFEVLEVLRSARCGGDTRAFDVEGGRRPLPAALEGWVRVILYDLLSEAVALDGRTTFSVAADGGATLNIRACIAPPSNGTSPEIEIAFRRVRDLVSAIGGNFRASHSEADGIHLEMTLPLGGCSEDERVDNAA